MTFTHNNNKYKIRFNYKNVNPTFHPLTERKRGNPFASAHGPWQETDNKNFVTRQTIASLELINDNDSIDNVTYIASGHATCVHGDVFCKETGRRTAITNMLKAFVADDKLMRKAIWECYNNRNKK